MDLSPRDGLLCAALFAAATALNAQPAPKAGAPDPLDPKAAVAPATHLSPLDRYRAAGNLDVANWREANDAVARIGGWRAYAREASRPEPAPGAPAPASAASRPLQGGGAHGKH